MSLKSQLGFGLSTVVSSYYFLEGHFAQANKSLLFSELNKAYRACSSFYHFRLPESFSL